MGWFWDRQLLKNVIAGLISAMIVSSGWFVYLKKTLPDYIKEKIASGIPEIVRVGQKFVRSSVVTDPDGTKLYDFVGPSGDQYHVIEDKDGKAMFFYMGPSKSLK
jgi:hypothetical protein